MAKVKPKMIYASSKEELKKRLVGLACEIQGSDQGDIEFQEVFFSFIFFFLLISCTSGSLSDLCVRKFVVHAHKQTCTDIWSALIRVQ